MTEIVRLILVCYVLGREPKSICDICPNLPCRSAGVS